jgi:hypothetical protein
MRCSICQAKMLDEPSSSRSICPKCSLRLATRISFPGNTDIQTSSKPAPRPNTHIQDRLEPSEPIADFDFPNFDISTYCEPLDWKGRCLTALAVVSTVVFILFLFAPLSPAVTVLGVFSSLTLLFGAAILLAFTQSHRAARDFGRVILAFFGMTVSAALALFVFVFVVCARR